MLDANQNLNIYNSKEKHKIAKLKLMTQKGKKLKISYFNKFISNFNEGNNRLTLEYLIFTCEKDSEKPLELDKVHLIEFQKKMPKPILPDYKTNDFINFYQDKYSTNLPKKKNYVVIYKIKDIILKCYPELFPAWKYGFSLRKIMKKHYMNALPAFEKSDSNFNASAGIGLQKILRRSINLSDKSDKIKEIDKMKHDLEKMKKEDDTFSFKPSEEQKEIPVVSTQKKNILYQAFKDIRNR